MRRPSLLYVLGYHFGQLLIPLLFFGGMLLLLNAACPVRVGGRLAAHGQANTQRINCIQTALALSNDRGTDLIETLWDVGRALTYGGQDVKADPIEGASCIRAAASAYGRNGHIEAQYFLGLAHVVGVGVLKDVVLAHKWASIAAMRGHQDAAKLRNHVAEEMSPAQLEESRELVLEWRETRWEVR